ncbi:unnamed protein product [Scytosiphon promiscuus]
MTTQVLILLSIAKAELVMVHKSRSRRTFTRTHKDVHTYAQIQVEYAMKAAEKGGLTIGVQTERGLVLAAHGRRRSPLLKSASVSKIATIDTRMCCAMSGLLSDGRLLLDYARTWVQEHRFEFDEAPSVEAVASQLSQLALKFNGYDKDGKVGSGGGREDGGDGNGGGLAMSRPVGVALLMAGVDREGVPVLYHLDPSGAYVQWRARAIGEKSAVAEAKLEKAGPFEGMDVRRAMVVVLDVLKEALGDDFSMDRLEMVCVDVGRAGDDDEDGDNVDSGTAQEAGRRNEERGVLEGSAWAHQTGKQPANAARSPTSGDPPLLPEGVDGNGVISAGAAERDVAVSRGNIDKASTSGPRSRYGSFRRVPTSEMEELLGDGAVR